MLPGEQKHFFWKWLYISLAIFLFVLFSLFLSFIAAKKYYTGKIYPNIHINNIALGGQTIDEAEKIINSKVDAIRQNGITFIYREEKTTIIPVISSVESDLAYEVINFDTGKALNEAGSYGYSADSLASAKQFLRALFRRQNFEVTVNINEDDIKKNLISYFAKFNKPAEDARLNYTKENDAFSFFITPEKNGLTLNFDESLSLLKTNLANLDDTAIELRSLEDTPQILTKNTAQSIEQAKNLLALSPLTLKYLDKNWVIKKDDLVSWLTLKKAAGGDNNEVYVGLENLTVKDFIDKKIATEINREPVDAKFEMKNGKIAEFQASQDGQKIDPEKSLTAIETALRQNGTSTAVLVVEESKSNIKTESVNDLGIKEVIGTGQSNFKGSPKNRRHNIRTGANRLNGILIKPEEEFSLIKTLGEIGSSTGYLTELVIKENKTIPEYGGGLCQIGTTMFRGALATGLPITMRRNHSYRVQYYEPAGTDATIYDPLPDLRFINDTGKHILIQSRIEGDLLYFDFWGTNDGRVATRTYPTIYNIVKPQPTKMVETLDLKPGEKKCTEKAHNGADAYFDYKVTYPNGEIKDKRFSSHYVPWREVCLLGVKELTAESGATSTLSTPPPAN